MYVLAAAGGRDGSVEQAAESISRSETITLAAIVLAAFSLRMAADIFLPNIHHPDEVFQYLEQGHRLAFGYGVVPWEYREGVRSWLLPGLLGGLMKATAWLGGGVTAPAGIDLGVERDPEISDLIKRLQSLTPQQTRVLGMLAEGLLNKQIAYELGVSEATIKAHVSAVLHKLAVDSRTQAVILLSRIGADPLQTTAG